MTLPTFGNRDRSHLATLRLVYTAAWILLGLVRSGLALIAFVVQPRSRAGPTISE